MNIDLIAMMTMLIIYCLFGIGILLGLIIMWSGQSKTPEEKYQEDLEQMEYLRNYKSKKYKKN